MLTNVISQMALRIEPGAEDIWSRLGVVTEALASDFFTVHDEQTSSLTVSIEFWFSHATEN